MAYSPANVPILKRISVVEAAGIQKIIKDWCGVDISLIEGGPCVTDPMGNIDNYLSFRDSEKGIALGISNGKIISIICNDKSIIKNG